MKTKRDLTKVKNEIRLPRRQAELLELVVNAKSIVESAEIMQISPLTVQQHLTKLKINYEVRTLQELICKYYKRKIKDIEENIVKFY